jgi:hypothetical protein
MKVSAYSVFRPFPDSSIKELTQLSSASALYEAKKSLSSEALIHM